MSNAFSGVGTKFYRATVDVHDAYKAIAEITSISGPGMSRETIDVTNLDSTGGYREFIASFRDAGEVTLNMNFTHTGYVLLKGDFESNDLRYYKIVFPNTTQTIFSFSGLVTQIPVDIPLDDKVTATCTIKISGSVTVHNGSSTTTTTGTYMV